MFLISQVKFDEGIQMIRDYGLQLYFETSAKTGENIEEVFKETTSFMYLKYNSIQLANQYMVPPKPIIIRKSVVLFLLGILCYFWLILTSENTKIKSISFSLFYGILDYFILHDLRQTFEVCTLLYILPNQQYVYQK